MAVAAAHGCRVENAGDRFDRVLGPAEADAIEQRFARDGEGPLVHAGSRLFDFGAARQAAGWQASNDVVLQLDASDEVVACDWEALNAYMAGPPPTLFHYELRLGDIVFGAERFYDRRFYVWRGRAHEGLYADPARPAAMEERRIRCTSQELTIRHHKDEGKQRTYLPGLALDALAFPDEGRWWHYLGRELYYQHRDVSAIAVLERHAAMPDAWIVERAQSLCFAGDCCARLGRMSDAAGAYQRAIHLDPTRREPRLRLAALHNWRGEFAEAAACAEQALAIPRTSHYPEPDANYTFVPHALLYWSLLWLGRRDAACEHWNICRRLAPDDRQVREHGSFFSDLTAIATHGRE
jgi:tetratricopeptide (TPR) repeat protein